MVPSAPFHSGRLGSPVRNFSKLDSPRPKSASFPAVTKPLNRSTVARRTEGSRFIILASASMERAFLSAHQPWGLILFKRNVESPDQLRRLTAGKLLQRRERFLVLAALALDSHPILSIRRNRVLVANPLFRHSTLRTLSALGYSSMRDLLRFLSHSFRFSPFLWVLLKDRAIV